jgi:hypothetical protein
MKEDTTRYIDLEDEDIVQDRCEFKKVQIYEHIDDRIKEENVFHAWVRSNDSFNTNYEVNNFVFVLCRLCIRATKMWKRWKPKQRS